MNILPSHLKSSHLRNWKIQMCTWLIKMSSFYRSTVLTVPRGSLAIKQPFKTFGKGFTIMTHICGDRWLFWNCGFSSNWILPYFPTVCPSVTGVTSHISHIYKGINAMLIIRGPIKPYIFWIKIILAIFLAKTRPDKTIFSALTNLTIDFDFELSKIWMLNAVFTLSCYS